MFIEASCLEEGPDNFTNSVIFECDSVSSTRQKLNDSCKRYAGFVADLCIGVVADDAHDLHAERFGFTDHASRNIRTVIGIAIDRHVAT